MMFDRKCVNLVADEKYDIVRFVLYTGQRIHRIICSLKIEGFEHNAYKTVASSFIDYITALEYDEVHRFIDDDDLLLQLRSRTNSIVID